MMNHADLARECAAIARTAGAAIMRIYDADYTIARKDDASPLTAADLAAHHAIVDGLAALTPQIVRLLPRMIAQLIAARPRIPTTRCCCGSRC